MLIHAIVQLVSGARHPASPEAVSREGVLTRMAGRVRVMRVVYGRRRLFPSVRACVPFEYLGHLGLQPDTVTIISGLLLLLGLSLVVMS